MSTSGWTPRSHPSLVNGWATALLIVKFDETAGQQAQSVFPSGVLSPSVLQEIKMMAMPDCLEESSGKHEFIFMIRVRDKVTMKHPFPRTDAQRR
jgi:hypothetical protein